MARKHEVIRKRSDILNAGSTCGDGDQEWDALASLLQRWTADSRSLMPQALRSDGSASFSTTRDADAGMVALMIWAPLISAHVQRRLLY